MALSANKLSFNSKIKMELPICNIASGYPLLEKSQSNFILEACFLNELVIIGLRNCDSMTVPNSDFRLFMRCFFSILFFKEK